LNIPTGPNFLDFLSLPNVSNSSKLSSISNSDIYFWTSFDGFNSALGLASKISIKIGNLYFSWVSKISFLKLFLDNDPIGLMSALEQSYLVKYPLKDSSKFDEPNTMRNPYFLLFHGINCAIR